MGKVKNICFLIFGALIFRIFSGWTWNLLKHNCFLVEYLRMRPCRGGKAGSAMSQHKGLESFPTEHHFFPWFSAGGVYVACLGNILEVFRGKIL